MSYALNIRATAASLRKKGYSIKEIAKQVGISVSTSSAWCSSIKIDYRAKQILETKKLQSLILANSVLNQKRDKIHILRNKQAAIDISSIQFSQPLCKILCAIFIWTEGGKSEKYRVAFTNSDPVMIKTFLVLFRRAFHIEEKKLRGLIHVHEYHNENTTRTFWSKITQIPEKQFTKSYCKPHTGKRIRDRYMGSMHLTYYDSNIAHELRAIYNTFADTLGMW